MRLLLTVFVGALLAAHRVPGLVIAKGAIQPHIAIDSDGNIYVVFIQGGNIKVAASTDKGKTFGEPVVAIDNNGRASGGMHRGPRIGVDAKKTLTVTAPLCFNDEEFKKKYPTPELWFTQSTDGGKTWSKPVRINEVEKKAPEALHWMAVAPSGEVHVSWLDIRDRKAQGQDLFYARIKDGKVGKNLKIAQTVCECCAPWVSVDEKGNPIVAFREGGQKPSREIFALRSTNRGDSFGSPVRLNTQPAKVGG